MEKVYFGTYFNTESVETMQEMFYLCPLIKTLDLSTFRTPALKNMADTFFQMESLVSLDLSKFDISSVSNMQNFLYNSNELVYLNLGSFEESNNYINLANFISPSVMNLICCIDQNKAPKIYNAIHNVLGNKWSNDCNNDCFTLQKPVKIIPELIMKMVE